MITIFIDNKPHQVRPDQNLLQACLSLGFDLPYFCWHPAMHSVGACRQCAVKVFKDEKDTRGRIVMSCMTPVADGMRLSIDDADARAFRSIVIEWLMLNHPHDCPVCDEGGECHLQDMTVMTGHNYRRNRFPKRTHRNQYLGPFVNHEMNRCIQCYRCVRYYRGVAGGRDLNVFSCHDNVYFGRAEDGALENEFCGNLVEICPTGVFTDKTLKEHYTRKWDLQTAPSVCVHCSVGCNTIAGERYGNLRRILNRFNHEVNGYFLCDRGRFGYGFVNSEKRVRTPMMTPPSPQPSPTRGEGVAKGTAPTLRAGVAPPLTGGVGEGEKTLKSVSKAAALDQIANILSNSRTIIGIGSPRASIESNFALRGLVRPGNFYSGMSAKEHILASLIIDILRNGPARSASLNDVRSADAILLLGEDVTNTAPLLALAVRQASRNRQFELAVKMKIPPWDDNAVRNAGQNEKSPVYIVSGHKTKLDDVAARTYLAAPADIARLGFAIAHELDPSSPSPLAGEGWGEGGHSEPLVLAKEIAAALKAAKRPLIISGTGCMSEAVLQSAANVALALHATGKEAHVCYAAPESNTIGLGLIGGKDIQTLFDDASPIDVLIIIENDLYRRADAKDIDALLDRAKNIIVIDHLMNPTAAKADILLPAATFAEATGTLVNNESRGQRFYQVFVPEGDIQAGWKWIDDIIHKSKESNGSKESKESKSTISQTRQTLKTLDSIDYAISNEMPIFKPILDIAPPADFRIDGQKIPRQPHRYSGRTAMFADRTMREPKPPEDNDTPLSFSMEGHEAEPPSELINRYWSAGWNSVQALNKFQQEVGGALNGGDPGKRLIEPSKDRKPAYFTVPSKSSHTTGSAPRYHIFGSEELSMSSDAVAEMATRSKLNNDD